MVSSSHLVYATPCPSGGRLLTPFPCSSVKVPLMGDSSAQTSPVWVFPTGCSSSRTAPPWVPSTRCSPSGTGCSSVGPPWGETPCQQTCSGVGSSLHKSWQQPAPVWAPHGITAFFRHPPAPARGPFHGLQVDICSSMDLHGLQGNNLPCHGLRHKLQGKALCSDISGTSPPSIFTDLGVCRVVSLT